MIIYNYSYFINNFYFIIPEIYFILGLCYIVFFFSIIKKYFNFIVIRHLNFLVIFFLFFILLFYIADFIDITFSVWLFNYFLKKNTFFLFASILVILLTLLFLIIVNLIITLNNSFNYSFDYVLVLLFSIMGLIFLFITNDLLLFYLNFELLSLSLYVLIACNNHSLSSVNSAIKYYVLGAISSSLMILGIVFIYGITGVTNYNDVINMLYFLVNDPNYSYLIIISISLFLVAILFKLGVFPFHFWLAEIYSGISYRTLFFLFLIPKSGLLFLLINFINNVFYQIFPLLHNIFLIIGLVCIFVGSFCGLAQRSIKRFLAFSSIVNLGYLLILLSTLSAYNIVFAFAYLISYFINLIVLFILILLLNKFTGYKELKITEINQLSNIFKTNPVIAILFAIVLFSIGGLPPFGGFYTKYFILVDLANNSLFFIIFLMLILSIVSTFYYIRIIKIIFFNKELLDNKTEFYYKNQNNVVNVTSGSNFVVIYFLLCLALFLLSLNIIIIFYPGLLFYPLFLLFL